MAAAITAAALEESSTPASAFWAPSVEGELLAAELLQVAELPQVAELLQLAAEAGP